MASQTAKTAAPTNPGLAAPPSAAAQSHSLARLPAPNLPAQKPPRPHLLRLSLLLLAECFSLFHWAATAHAEPAPRHAKSLRDQFGVEQLIERSNGPDLAERQRAQIRLATLGSPQALQHLNAALLRVLPRAKQNASELQGLIEALAPHAADPETQVSLLRVVLGSVGPQGEPIDAELRQMAALAIAAQRDAAAVRSLHRALLADDDSARFATTALLAHPPRDGTPLPPFRALPTGSEPSNRAAASSSAKHQSTAALAALVRDGDRMPTAQLLALLSAGETAPLAACQLAARDEPRLRPTLEALLRSPQRSIRLRTAMGLGASPRADATGLLLRSYRDAAWQVRWAALYALAQRRDALRLRTLERAAQIEPNGDVRDLARALLVQDPTTPKAGCPVLLPLPGLNAADDDPTIADSSKLPEAAPSAKGFRQRP